MIVRGPDAEPEWTTSWFAVGDTVRERYDGGAERDFFLLNATAGSELVGFVGLDSASGPVVTSFNLTYENTTLKSSGFTSPNEPLGQYAFLATITTTGQHSLQFFATGNWSGQYRFVFVPRNRAPESRGATFAPGDTVSEAIDEFFDVDEFSFQAAAGTEWMFNVSTAKAFPSEIAFRVYDVDWNELFNVRTTGEHPSLEELGAPIWRVPVTGTYRVRVSSTVPSDGRRRSEVVGAYRFEFQRVDRAPEFVPAATSIGATITGESIRRRGEIDEFTFSADSGDHFAMNQVTQFGTAGGSVEVNVESPSGAFMLGTGHYATSTQRDSSFSRTLVAEETGTYTIRVVGSSHDAVPYTIRTYPIDPGPENVSASVSPGAWVEGESLDVPGDVDRYRLAVIAGQTYAFQLESPAILTGPVSMEGLLPGMGVVRSPSQGSSRVVAGSTGIYELTVARFPTAEFGTTGPYRFRITVTDRRPETTDSLIAVGDTVNGEGIEEYGDIDEYYITASETDTLLVTLTPALVAPGRFFGVSITEVATGATSGGGVVNGSTTFEFVPPFAGTLLYRIRVMALDPTEVGLTGAYQLVVRRKP